MSVYVLPERRNLAEIREYLKSRCGGRHHEPENEDIHALNPRRQARLDGRSGQVRH
jgi:hypothetical protein